MTDEFYEAMMSYKSLATNKKVSGIHMLITRQYEACLICFEKMKVKK